MVRLIHEVLMEGNCYSWLCRLMNTGSFSQHCTLPGAVARCCPTWRGAERPLPERSIWGWDGLAQPRGGTEGLTAAF